MLSITILGETYSKKKAKLFNSIAYFSLVSQNIFQRVSSLHFNETNLCMCLGVDRFECKSNIFGGLRAQKILSV